MAEWERCGGNKKGLVKLRACGTVKAVRDGGGQQNSIKTITSHSHLIQKKKYSLILCFTTSFRTQLSLQLLLDGATALGIAMKFFVHLQVSLQHVTAFQGEVYESITNIFIIHVFNAT